MAFVGDGPDEEALSEFFVEAWELLETLDQALVQLESRKTDEKLLGSVFRVLHTLKGNAGFLNLSPLEDLSHSAESVLDRVRAGERPLDQMALDLLFETADNLRRLLERLEKEGEYSEPPRELISRLERWAEVATNGVAHARPSEVRLVEIPEIELEPEEPPPLVEEQFATAELLSEAVRQEGEDSLPPDASHASEQWARVRVDLLDKLMNLVGELVLCRNQLLQLAARSGDEGILLGTQRLNLATSDLQEHVTRTRMQPVSSLLSRFPRIVRELAKLSGKEVRLQLEGQETGLDRTLLEAVRDPLLHILRNAIDHGIETPQVRREQGKPAAGTLRIAASHEGGQVSLEVSDDGHGIDVEKIRRRALQRGLLSEAENARLPDHEALKLIFHAGVSTAETVTSLSGRGVGMDVVRTAVERIGGTVDVTTVPGEGTTVKLRIPLTLAIIPALMIQAGQQAYAIPQINLQEIVHLDPRKVEKVHDTELYRLRGHLIPLLRLRSLLGVPGEDENSNVVVVQTDGRPFGLAVDAGCDTEEIVVKPLHRELKSLLIYAGATITGEGKVALILDIGGIAQASGLRFHETGLERARDKQEMADRKQSVLLFHLGDGERFGIPLALVSRLEEFSVKQVEMAAGRRLVQYRGRLLPLLCLGSALGRPPQETETLSVLVFADGERSLGIIVSEILDIVEDAFELDSSLGNLAGVLGTAIIQGSAVTIIDVLGLLRQSYPEWLTRKVAQNVKAHGSRILLAQDSEFFRSLTRSYLESEGYSVLEAPGREQAMHLLTSEEVDSVVVDVAMEGSRELLAYASAERPAVVFCSDSATSLEPALEMGGVQLLRDFHRDGLIEAVKRSRGENGHS